MADEKKTEASTKPKAAAKPAAAKPAAAEPRSGQGGQGCQGGRLHRPKTARSKATPAVTDGPTCKVEGCKQGVRAKGFCRKHFMGWRRGGLGDAPPLQDLQQRGLPQTARQGRPLRRARGQRRSGGCGRGPARWLVAG